LTVHFAKQDCLIEGPTRFPRSSQLLTVASNVRECVRKVNALVEKIALRFMLLCETALQLRDASDYQGHFHLD
jgi:hypothetical protein